MGFNWKGLIKPVATVAGGLIGGPAGAALGYGLAGGLDGGIKGDEGGFETSQVPRWNTQQNALFQQLYGGLSPKMNKGMAPTSEEGDYSRFLSNYEPWYRGVVNEAYNPEAVRKYYETSVMPSIEATVAPKVAAQYGGPGYWGSARARALSDLYAGVGRQEAADIYGVENSRNTAIADLTNRLPVAKETAARWSRTFTPEAAPYFSQALSLLGLQPYDTLAAYKQPTPGLLDSIMPAAGSALGKQAPAMLSTLAKALGIGM